MVAQPGDPGDDPEADAESVARSIALRKLAVAPQTRAQLEDAMRRRGVPDQVCDHVLGRFSAVGLIDDALFALMWVESRHSSRGLGRRALAHELRRRGVAESLVDDALADLDPEREEATARSLVARKLESTRGLDPVVRSRRLAGMLARKGYPSGLSIRVVRDALAGADVDDLDLPDDPDR